MPAVNEHYSHLENPFFQTPQPGSTFWDALNQVGLNHMRKLSISLGELAPKPGFLVYLEAKTLSYRLNDMTPIIYSAIDVCTQLQVSRLYLTMTIASALDFLDFSCQKFPFRISEVETPLGLPFTNSSILQAHHRFTSAAAERGILHSITPNRSEKETFSAISKLTFGGILEGSVEPTSEQKLMRELINFLFFHNNHRPLPTLEGKTPLQKLKLFVGYERIHTFDPYESFMKPSKTSAI